MANRNYISEKFLHRRTEWLVLVVLLAGVISLPAWAAEPVVVADDTCPAVEIPNEDAWAGSGHADAESEAFNHWNDDDPAEVSTSCAKCHSTPGQLDFLGADGTEAGVVDNPAPIGTTVECMACHNDVAAVTTSVTMPSGAELTALGSEATCMQCHQGRESGVSVDEYIADKEVVDEDAVSSALSFRNIHYLPAAATQYGALAMGGYQYEGKHYDVKFAHVEGLDSCIDCHNPHSLDIKIEACVVCHEGAVDHEGIKTIRMVGSAHDYDGDGDTAEGISGEITGLQAALYAAMRAYAADKGTPIAYDSHAYPYFFVDDNDNGAVDPNETTRYGAWTARLLKASFNYQFSVKDPGAFAHNGKYMIQLLHDSVEDLDAAAVATLTRDDAGHFAGSGEPFRHWDEDGAVSGSCSKCHSATGLPFYLDEGVTVSQAPSNGLMCTTCHDAMPAFTRHPVDEVAFPSGAELTMGDSGNNLCISCHQGRESGASIETAIAGLDLDIVSSTLSFKNVHYMAAGATLFGTEAGGAYEYPGKTYLGRFGHISSFDSCTECHDAHVLDVQTQACASAFCHGTSNPKTIRKSPQDFDGDGSKTEGLAAEVETLQDVLYGAMRDYAANIAGTPIVYDAHAYPYFFADADNNGQVDEGEGKYAAWTPRLLAAAYNYQFAQKDPGAYAHNGKYLIQVLYDGIENLGTQVTVDMAGMVRP